MNKLKKNPLKNHASHLQKHDICWKLPPLHGHFSDRVWSLNVSEVVEKQNCENLGAF